MSGEKLSTSLGLILKEVSAQNYTLGLWLRLEALWPLVVYFLHYPCSLEKIVHQKKFHPGDRAVLCLYCSIDPSVSWRFVHDQQMILSFLQSQLHDIENISIILLEKKMLCAESLVCL